MTDYMPTVFLHPPSIEGFDGGAGARYQARREVRSFWYPTWLAQPAALVPGGRLVDAPPAGLGLADVVPLARRYDLAVLHTSTPSFAYDVRLLLVGYESGNQAILNNVKKGIRLDVSREFTRNARRLGIKIHGTFILGLPGETRETIEETIRFVLDVDADTVQVSLAAPYPGTAHSTGKRWSAAGSRRSCSWTRAGSNPRRSAIRI
jgi:hypothetical protein